MTSTEYGEERTLLDRTHAPESGLIDPFPANHVKIIKLGDSNGKEEKEEVSDPQA